MYWENHRRPLRTYRRHNVTEFAFDGDIEPEAMTNPTSDGYEQQIVCFDRRNRYNGAIVAAARALVPEVRDPRVRGELIRVCQVLSPQTNLVNCERRRVPSRAKSWQPIYDLSLDVLDGFGLGLNASLLNAPGFILDTWRVWEDLLSLGLRMAMGPPTVVCQRAVVLGERSSFDENGRSTLRRASVTPDVLLVGSEPIVVDAKYKGRVSEERGRIAESDLYEALAYASATDCLQVILAYPLPARGDKPSDVGVTRVFERVAVRGVTVSGVEVEVRGISGVGALRRFATNFAAGVQEAVQVAGSGGGRSVRTSSMGSV